MVHDFFGGCMTSAEIKTRYRDLCRKHHPDLGGDTATMQELNSAYDQACKTAQRGERPDKSENAYDFYAEADTAVREAIDRVITLPNITIEICGWWVWLSGDTRAVKDTIKAAGYKWSSKKSMWYYPGCPSKGRGGMDIDEIREVYGSQVMNGKSGKRQIVA